MKNIEAKQPRYMRPAALKTHLGIGASTLWDWVKKYPSFPRPIKAGPRVTLFDVDAVDAYVRGRASV